MLSVFIHVDVQIDIHMDIHARDWVLVSGIFRLFFCLDVLSARAACFLTCPSPTAHAAPPLRVHNTPFTRPFF